MARAAAGEQPLAFDLDAAPPSPPSRRATAALVHTSPQSVGLDAGAWCAYGNPADLPVDQRATTPARLSFDSAPLGERVELLGQPVVELRVASDQPRGFVTARLCDVAPGRRVDGHHPRLLNLCHPDGHEPRARPGRARR